MGSEDAYSHSVSVGAAEKEKGEIPDYLPSGLWCRVFTESKAHGNRDLWQAVIP